MGRSSNAWRLSKASWQVLSRDRELIAVPVVAGIAAILAFVVVSGPGVLLLADSDGDGDSDSGATSWALAIVIALVTGVVVLQAIGLFAAVAWIAVVMAVTSALSAVFKAALHRHATGQPVDAAFTPTDLSTAFRPR